MDILELFNDDEVYYSDRDYLSNSSLKLMKESPKKFWLWKNRKWSQPDNAAFNVGRALHARFLEDKENYIAWDGQRRGAEYTKFTKENKDIIVLTQSEKKLVDDMYKSLNFLDDVKELMTDAFKPEVPAVMSWFVGEEGHEVRFKGKADAIVEKNGRRYIVDLKTTKDDLGKWANQAKWNYAQQAYLYKELFQLDEFYFLVVQKSFPYDVGIFEVSDSFFGRGEMEFNDSLNMYKRLFIDGEFNNSKAVRGIL